MLKVISVALCMLGMLQPAHAQEKEGGIIGTGVLGQVTALGSIYVNGLHITFSPDIVLEGAQDVKDLLPGMTVAVSVQNDNGVWVAHSIRRVSSLVGPVTGPSEVMGVKVVGSNLPLQSWVQ